MVEEDHSGSCVCALLSKISDFQIFRFSDFQIFRFCGFEDFKVFEHLRI